MRSYSAPSNQGVTATADLPAPADRVEVVATFHPGATVAKTSLVGGNSRGTGCSGPATLPGQHPSPCGRQPQPRRVRQLHPRPGRHPADRAARHPRAQRHRVDRPRWHPLPTPPARPLCGRAHGGGAALLPHRAVQALRAPARDLHPPGGLPPDPHLRGRRGEATGLLHPQWHPGAGRCVQRSRCGDPSQRRRPVQQQA